MKDIPKYRHIKYSNRRRTANTNTNQKARREKTIKIHTFYLLSDKYSETKTSKMSNQIVLGAKSSAKLFYKDLHGLPYVKQ